MQFIIKSVNITDNLCTEQGKLDLKFLVYNQERVIMVLVRQISSVNWLETVTFSEYLMQYTV